MGKYAEALKAKLANLGKAKVGSIQDFVKGPQKQLEQIYLENNELFFKKAISKKENKTQTSDELITDATNNCKDVFLNELEHILPEYERKIASCLEPELKGSRVKCENNGFNHYETCIVLENRTMQFAAFRINCNTRGNYIILERIAVHNSLRRRNIGRTVISAIEEAAKRSGCEFLYVVPGGYSFHGNMEEDAFFIDLYGKHAENSEITDQNRVAFYKSCGFTALVTKEYGVCPMWKPIN